MTMVGVWNDGKRTNLFESSAQPITMVDVDAKYVQAYVAATDEQGNGFSIKRGSQSMPWIVPTGYTIHE